MAWCHLGNKTLSKPMMTLMHKNILRPQRVNTLRLRQDGYHFPDDIFKSIFLNGNVYKFWLRFHWSFVDKGPINNIGALFQIMACCCPGPCITNVFATRRKNFSQWHRSFQRKLLSHWLKFLRHVAITLVIQGPGNKPLSEPMMASLLMYICITQPQWVNGIILYATCLVM